MISSNIFKDKMSNIIEESECIEVERFKRFLNKYISNSQLKDRLEIEVEGNVLHIKNMEKDDHNRNLHTGVILGSYIGLFSTINVDSSYLWKLSSGENSIICTLTEREEMVLYPNPEKY